MSAAMDCGMVEFPYADQVQECLLPHGHQGRHKGWAGEWSDQETADMLQDFATEANVIEVDCHAYAWHLVDLTGDMPECGPDNLVRMAEQYGVLVEFLPDHDLANWAWWYRLTGPYSHLVDLLAVEYAGGVYEAIEMVDSLI